MAVSDVAGVRGTRGRRDRETVGPAPVWSQCFDPGVKLLAWTDGGGGSSTPDPVAYIGARITDESGTLLWEHSEAIGETTHNVAEYEAVLAAIREAKARGATGLLIKSDSQLVVNQINGEFKVKAPHLVVLRRQVLDEIEGLDFEIMWVRRTENTDADDLTRKPRPSR